MALRAPISLYTFLALSMVLISFGILWFPPNILNWDVFGYYLYLPATFIYHDLPLQDIDTIKALWETYKSSGTFYQAFELPNGNWVMKYSVGLAILYLPGFLIGHVAALLLNYPADGFSLPYQVGMAIEMVAVLILGLWLLRKALLHFFGDCITAMVLLSIVFGTNYFIGNMLVGGGMQTHGFLFTLYAALLLYTIKWHETHDTKAMLILAIICGMIVLSRPSEIVCLFIPLLWGMTSWSTAKAKILLLASNWKQVLLFSLVIACIGSVQLAYWKYVTGDFYYYSYGGSASEAFNFDRPHVWDVLFSYRKGWFVYTPMMFLATLGLLVAWKRKMVGWLGILVYVSLNLYIISSWHCWWYAESYGQRALIQSYPIMAIGLGFVFTGTNRWVRPLPMMLAFSFIGLSVFQSYQFKAGVIDASRQTAKYFWASFWDSSPRSERNYLKLVDRGTWAEPSLGSPADYYLMVINNFDFEDGDKVASMVADSNVAYQGKFAGYFDDEYSAEHLVRYSTLTSGHYVWIRVSAMVFPKLSVKDHPFSLAIGTHHNGIQYQYQGVDTENLQIEHGKWNLITIDYLSPEMRAPQDDIKAFIWNRGRNQLLVDNYKMEVFVPKFDPVRD